MDEDSALYTNIVQNYEYLAIFICNIKKVSCPVSSYIRWWHLCLDRYISIMISDIPFRASIFMLAGNSMNNEIRATDIVKL